MVPRGKDGGRDSQGVCDGHGHTAVFNMENQQGPAGTGKSAQCHVAAWMGGKFGGEWIHECVSLSPFAVPLKPSQHWLSAVHQCKIRKYKSMLVSSGQQANAIF